MKAPEPCSSRAEDEKGFLKMKELVTATGLPKSTVLHYLNQGLLPQPVRTGRNMAYYHPSCVERIRLIRQLQTHHRLTLAAIREYLDRRDPDTEIPLLLEFREYVFGPAGRPVLSIARFSEATGLTPEQVDREIAAGVLAPLETGRFDQDDVAVGRVRKRGLEQGIGPRDVHYYREAAEAVVDQEMALRERVVADMPFEQMAVTTIEMTRGARVLRAYSVDRAFQQRIQKLQRFEQSRVEDTGGQAAGGQRMRRSGRSTPDHEEEDEP